MPHAIGQRQGCAEQVGALRETLMAQGAGRISKGAIEWEVAPPLGHARGPDQGALRIGLAPQSARGHASRSVRPVT